MTKFVLKKSKAINKKDYEVKEEEKKDLTKKEIKALQKEKNLELKFDKKTDVVPIKTNKLLCCIFTTDKKCSMVWRKFNISPNQDEVDFFRFKKGMYIIDAGGVHITSNGIRIAFYFEGISTPLKITDIETETKKVKYFDLQGNEQESIIHKIKHLKVDAKILDVFLNRRFSEIFTRDRTQYYLSKKLIFMGIISIIMTGITLGGVIVSKVF